MSAQNNLGYDSPRAEAVKSENIKYTAPAVDNIRKDIDSLQSDVASLAADVKQASSDKAQNVIDYVNGRIDSLKTSGTNTFGKLEESIKSKPGQSITIAFVVGALTSYLFSRKSS